MAPNLRRFERSSPPEDVAAYRPEYLVHDIAALMAIETGGVRPLECLTLHQVQGTTHWIVHEQQTDWVTGLLHRFLATPQ